MLRGKHNECILTLHASSLQDKYYRLMTKKAFYVLADFDENIKMDTRGKNYRAKCPECGKWNLYISKKTGLYNCFTGGCEFKGILQDSCEAKPVVGATSTGVLYPKGKKVRFVEDAQRADGCVKMLPTDYKRLAPDVLAAIKPVREAAETSDLDEEAAWLYLGEMGISRQTAERAQVGCLMTRFIDPDSKVEGGSTMRLRSLAYVNYVNGKAVNVKYRSCEVSRSTPKDSEGRTVFKKYWSQDSPTTPCAPYHIDCINPLLVEEEVIERLIITEGEKDVLSLLEAGYPYVISVPNGASCVPEKAFEAFESWLAPVNEVVLCGDTDLPGRTLVKKLADYFGPRSMVVTLPADCKDISDVLTTYGVETVRSIIDGAQPQHTDDIITVEERADEVLEVLQGRYDKGYDVGFGPLTDRVFHPTDIGGLIIVTGKPNSGKTDFLNDLTCRLMMKTGRHVCYLSFEVPDKNKHIAHLVRLALGQVNTARYTKEELAPLLQYLNAHMVHLDLHEVSPTPAHILERADRVRRTLPIKYLVIDPYLFMEVETGRYSSETQAIKAMLTQVQTWGRAHGVWVVIVAHPRKLMKLWGSNESEDIDMYTIAGSANWANLADFILSITRVDEEEKRYTRLDMLKVRDQDLCRKGSVVYVRQPCGRYDERESVEQVVAEMQGKVLERDSSPWLP